MVSMTPSHYDRASTIQLYRSVWLRDALLLFKSLCKLSVSNVERLDQNNYASAGGQQILRSNGLVLELIKIILDNSGRIFEREEAFAMYARNQYICISLLKHSMAPVAPNTQYGQKPCTLATSIFISLLLKFRAKLKSEVGIFFPLIILKGLEPVKAGAATHLNSQVSTPMGLTEQQHRAIVIKCTIPLITDGQCIIDLFVNYDCDLEGQNLLERLLNGFVVNA